MENDKGAHTTLTAVAFPSVVLMQNYRGASIDALNTGLAVLIRGLESRGEFQANKTATQGGFHTRDEFINSDDGFVREFRDDVLVPAVQQYMSTYYRFMFAPDEPVTPAQLHFKGWANIMRKGSWNAPHDHITAHNRISLVYYIRLPSCEPPEGTLQFENSNPISTQHGAFGNMRFHPKEGDLIMFPSYMKHFSHPFSSDDERILIAADVRVMDRFDENRANNSDTLIAYTQ